MDEVLWEFNTPDELLTIRLVGIDYRICDRDTGEVKSMGWDPLGLGREGIMPDSGDYQGELAEAVSNDSMKYLVEYFGNE